MSAKDNGGQAFPGIRIISGDNYNPPTRVYFSGMTLRDYFAAKSMQGIVCGQNLKHLTVDQIAVSAYEMADAMLKARNE